MTEDEKAKLEIDKAIKIVNAYNDGYKCGRADAIEEYANQIKEMVADTSKLRTDNISKDLILCNDTDKLYDLIDFLAEQLKEQKNDD